MGADGQGTFAYFACLDALAWEPGGHRGKAAVASATSGCSPPIRHATSRAGERSPHDDLLMVNTLE